MRKWFLLAVLALPIVEIALFVEVGGLIGVWATLGLVILSAVVGVALLRHNSIQALMRLQPALATGNGGLVPAADRGLVALAGLLLLVPGFFTDAVALLLLVPAVRAWLIAWAGVRIAARMETARPAARDTIDVDYEIVEDPGPAVRRRSGWTRH